MSSKREQALHMYLNEQCSQRHIAQTVGVSERTLYNWINDNAWDRLKKASYAAPVMIADNICFQIVNMQEAIAGRAQGQQFPTMQEAEIIRKLVVTLDKLKRFPSISQNMQVLETFRRFVWNGSPNDAAAIDRWKTRFLEGTSKNGFLPYETEYNTNSVYPANYNDTDLPSDFENHQPTHQPATTPQKAETHTVLSESEIVPQKPPQHTHNQQLTSFTEQELNQKKSEITPATSPATNQPSGSQQAPFATTTNQYKDQPKKADNSHHNQYYENLITEYIEEMPIDSSLSPQAIQEYKQSVRLVMRGNLENFFANYSSQIPHHLVVPPITTPSLQAQTW